MKYLALGTYRYSWGTSPEQAVSELMLSCGESATQVVLVTATMTAETAVHLARL